jgi:hypothetical protein
VAPPVQFPTPSGAQAELGLGSLRFIRFKWALLMHGMRIAQAGSAQTTFHVGDSLRAPTKPNPNPGDVFLTLPQIR